MLLAVLLLDEAEPVTGHLHHVGQLLVYLCYLLFDACYVLLGLVLVELQDARHLDFHESQDVLLCHLPYELGVVGREAFVDMLAGCIHRGGILELLVLVDALLDEYLFQTGKVQLFQQFSAPYEAFLAQQFQGAIY